MQPPGIDAALAIELHHAPLHKLLVVADFPLDFFHFGRELLHLLHALHALEGQWEHGGADENGEEDDGEAVVGVGVVVEPVQDEEHALCEGVHETEHGEEFERGLEAWPGPGEAVALERAEVDPERAGFCGSGRDFHAWRGEREVEVSRVAEGPAAGSAEFGPHGDDEVGALDGDPLRIEDGFVEALSGDESGEFRGPEVGVGVFGAPDDFLGDHEVVGVAGVHVGGPGEDEGGSRSSRPRRRVSVPVLV